MKNKLFKLILILVCILCLISCNKESHYDDNIDKVIKVITNYELGNSSGTGFFISNDGLILTNKHVINGCNNITIIYQDNEYEADIIKISDKYDLALLKIEANTKYFEISESFNIGEDIYSIGNTNNYGLFYYEGIISGYNEITYNGEQVLTISTNIEIYKGDSGAPLYNSNNKLLGIMTFRIKDNNSYIPGLSFAIPAVSINDFLNNE